MHSEWATPIVVRQIISTEYVVINTHKGLYEYRRLPFGVASAPAIFQKVMDTILQGLSVISMTFWLPGLVKMSIFVT